MTGSEEQQFHRGFDSVTETKINSFQGQEVRRADLDHGGSSSQ